MLTPYRSYGRLRYLEIKIPYCFEPKVESDRFSL